MTWRAKTKRLKEGVQAEFIWRRWKKFRQKTNNTEATEAWDQWPEDVRLEFVSIAREMRPWMEESGTWAPLEAFLQTKGIAA